MANEKEPDKTELEQMDEALDSFETYLKGNGTTVPSLRQNWIYLQIFSIYGLRLPQTAAALQTALHMKPSDTGGYTWFNDMYTTYADVGKSSHYFFEHVFKDMNDLGGKLRDFSKDSGGDESLMDAVLDLIGRGDNSPLPDPADREAALALVEELNDRASEAAKFAATIQSDLVTYRTGLIPLQASVTRVRKAVDEDSKTSDAAYNKLAGSKDVEGSIAQLLDKLEKDRREYVEDVKIAATTPTYGWIIVPPIGIWAAAIVAGIYGRKATEMLETIEKLEAQIKTASEELIRVTAVRCVTKLAHDSLDSVGGHLDVAIDKAEVVRKAWDGVKLGLDFIKSQVEHSLKPDHDDPEKQQLQAIKAVRYFIKRSSERWISIRPDVDALTKDPFISIDPEDMNLSSFIEKVKQEMERKN